MSKSMKELKDELTEDCKASPYVSPETRDMYFKAFGTYDDNGTIHKWYSSLNVATRGDGGYTFTKDDSAKPMLSLIEPQFILKLGAILTFGATTKYTPGNWKLCDDTSRYKDALLRHTYAYLDGELIDFDSGIEHTACIAFNTMALQWFDNNTPS